MPAETIDARPLILQNQEAARTVADTVMGGTATPEEIEIVKESAADSFEKLQQEGNSREVAARMVDQEMQRIMREKFTTEEIAMIEQQARSAAAARAVKEMEDWKAIYDQVARQQMEGGPEVVSQGRTVTNPEFRAESSVQQAA